METRVAATTPSDEILWEIGAALVVVDDVVDNQASSGGVATIQAVPAVPLQDLESHAFPARLAKTKMWVATLPSVVVRPAELCHVLRSLRFSSKASADRAFVLWRNDLVCSGGAHPRSSLFQGRLLLWNGSSLVVGDHALLKRSAVRRTVLDHLGVASATPAKPVHVAPPSSIDESSTAFDRTSLAFGVTRDAFPRRWSSFRPRHVTQPRRDQVGSSTPGSDLTVFVRYQRTGQ
jgi:hypothetical protein